MDKLFEDFKVSCNNCNLDSICLPRGLSREEIDDLSIVVKNNATLEKGEYIYRQGDSFNGILAIKSGAAKLVTVDAQGNDHILNVLLPGELIGLDGIFQSKYSCSAIALDSMSYCKLPADQFDALCVKVPAITREFFKHFGEAINNSQEHLVASQYSAEEKLALFLTSLSDRLHNRGFSSLKFNLPLTRQEMGEHLGLTLETVSRMLKHFQNEGLIRVQRKYIEIIDLQKLKQIYQE